MPGPIPASEALQLALVGVPNCGKTGLFNRLTGSRQKVANYAGVTVERKEGSFASRTNGRRYRLLDLPGAYSLTPTTLKKRAENWRKDDEIVRALKDFHAEEILIVNV